jgi:hypothetical protein
MFKEAVRVYYENYTKLVNTLCGGNAELLIHKTCVQADTTGLNSFKTLSVFYMNDS